MDLSGLRETISARSATRKWVPDRRSGQVKKLYIGNLPFSATEEQLNEWFSQVGVTPSGVNLIRDRFTGQSRGFAFVEVTNDEDADRAINSLNGQNFGGRNLDRKSTRLNSSHSQISYAVFCLKKKKKEDRRPHRQ